MTVLTVLSRKKEESSPRYARVAGAGRRCHRLVMPGQEEQGGVIASLCRCTGGACSRCTQVGVVGVPGCTLWYMPVHGLLFFPCGRVRESLVGTLLQGSPAALE